MNLTEKLIAEHQVDGEAGAVAGEEISIAVDQTLAQDATGTLVMLEYEALDAGRVATELSVQYVDHNLLQTDHRNADDHRFLRTACEKYGVWYSRPGNGVSHAVHMQCFGAPGRSLLGADSHTCAGGSLGMLAIGAGGLDVALAMAGRPFVLRKPRVLGVRFHGELPDWVSAKDVILEMLRRRGVAGAVGMAVEYYGPGLENLAAMDRHVIANMGAEMGATATVFPADEETRRFLRRQGREEAWREMAADPGADYDEREEIDLSALEPLIALPGSPGNVAAVREVAGEPIEQAYIGSSANPGLRDFAVPALMVEGRKAASSVSFDINPTSRQMLNELTRESLLGRLIMAGARIHQAGCNGCIGVGQAPGSKGISLRTVPRNFPGRSGTAGDRVYLCSPETAAASALTGKITDPRTLEMDCPRFVEPEPRPFDMRLFVSPSEGGADREIERGPGIEPLPEFQPLPDALEGPVLVTGGDDISTDEILPAGAKILPLRSSIREISAYTFRRVDERFVERADEIDRADSFVVAGANYGQGSSREHAALAPRCLGVRAVFAVSFARIHEANLVNFGVIPLVFADPDDRKRIGLGDRLVIDGVRHALKGGGAMEVRDETAGFTFEVRHRMSDRAVAAVLAGGVINLGRLS